MEDTDSSYPQRFDIQSQQHLHSEITTSNPQTKSNPSKFFSNFPSKSVLVAILLILLPLFPSQAPEFVNQTILTRSWELLHLLFVGIAVSYGLFSRRNVETEKENQSKFDNTQTYMSRILQVSSVFDDEMENPSSGSDDNKIQTWNSQYFRGNPMVLVAQTDPVVDEQSNSISTSTSSSSSSSNINKPLLLPVRSLRSQVSNISVNESGRSSGSLSRSGSGVKNISSSNSFGRTRSGEIVGLDPHELEEKLKENVVLPSPIPWRSRSGRMEMKEEMGGAVTPPLYSLPPSVGESEFDRIDSRVHRSSMSWSSRPSSTSSSPRKLSPSPSVSSEIQSKNVEDMVKKKNHYKSSPPPPPPPPPPVYRKSPLMMSNSNPFVYEVSSENDYKTSFKDELKDFSRKTKEDVPSRRETGSGSSMLNSLKSEAKPRNTYFEGSAPVGKSVRTIRGNEQINEVGRTKDVSGDRKERSTGKRFKEVETVSMETTGTRAEVIDQQPVNTETNRREIPLPSPKPTLPKYPKKEKKAIFEKVIMDSDEESDFQSDASATQDNSDAEEITTNNTISDAGPNPNEVDRKADEFIAKFREQIRLQRIESIKKTSVKNSNRNPTR